MAVREQAERVALVHDAVAGDVLDLVVQGVSDLTFTLGEVPEQAVEDRAAQAFIRTSEQREFLVEQRGLLVLEAEAAAGQIAHVEGDLRAAVADRRIHGVIPGFVAEERVEVGEPAGSEHQRREQTRRRHRRGRSDAHVAGALEDGLIEFDEADVLDDVLVRVEGDRTTIGSAQGAEQAGRGGRAVRTGEFADTGLIGIDAVEHTLHPAHGQLRTEVWSAIAGEVADGGIGGTGPVGPVGRRTRGSLHAAVAGVEQVVGEQQRGIAVEVDLVQAGRAVRVAYRVPGRGSGGDIAGDIPDLHRAVFLVVPPRIGDLIHVATKVGRVSQGDLLVEDIRRQDRLQGAAILQQSADLDDVHGNRGITQGRVIVFGERDVDRGLVGVRHQQRGIADEGEADTEAGGLGSGARIRPGHQTDIPCGTADVVRVTGEAVEGGDDVGPQCIRGGQACQDLAFGFREHVGLHDIDRRGSGGQVGSTEGSVIHVTPDPKNTRRRS